MRKQQIGRMLKNDFPVVFQQPVRDENIMPGQMILIPLQAGTGFPNTL